MKSYFISIHKALFDDRVSRARTAFYSACQPFYDEITAAREQAKAFQQLVDAGEAQWDETDEERGITYSYGEVFSERTSDSNDALLVLRKAFVIVIYHYWERGALRWVSHSKKRHNHGDLVEALQSNGVSLDVEGLNQLNMLVNCLKHNSRKSGPDLYRARHDLFEPGIDPSATHPGTGKLFRNLDWAENIVLIDDNMEQFFTTVRSSAPR